ncbi:MAG: ABC transporter ATP-binding protein [Oscillospiraceae bacterium]|nr:ABC transporter ATP-binding protein [Oscillospiraceae bacterium]
MLEIRNLSAGYGENPVIEEISLAFPKEKVTVLAGPNGCGKSTLLKAAAGILESRGEVLLEGVNLKALPPRLRAQRISFLPQSRAVPEITVSRLVLHGRFPYLHYPRQYGKADHAAAEAAMDAMEITHLAQRPLPSLSGGQQQKAYIAMALAQDTDAVLLDEPTAFLDIAHQLQLMDLAKKLAAKGKTVVLVLHDLTLALEYADALVLLQSGKVKAQGTPEEVFHTGCIREVFGVDVGRTAVDGKQKYFYL